MSERIEAAPAAVRHAAATRPRALLLAGIVLLAALVAWQGIDVLTDGIAHAGPSLLWLIPAYAAPLLLAARSWRALLPAAAAPAPRYLLQACWIGRAVNWLLPVAQIGGEAVRARLLIVRSTPPETAVASVIADKTVEAASIPAFALLGAAAYAATGHVDGILAAALAAAAVLAGLIAAFLFVQHAGAAGLARRALPVASAFARTEVLVAGAERFDAALRATYAQRARLGAAFGWRLGYRLALVGELWLIAWLFGQPLSLRDAAILDSLAAVVTAAGFLIPGALGVQEAGFMLLSTSLGLGAELGLALSLARRVRELAVGLPALLWWQWWEVRMLARR